MKNTTDKSSESLPLDLVNRCPDYQSTRRLESKQEVNPTVFKSISYSFSSIYDYRAKRESPKFMFQSYDLPN